MKKNIATLFILGYALTMLMPPTVALAADDPECFVIPAPEQNYSSQEIDIYFNGYVKGCTARKTLTNPDCFTIPAPEQNYSGKNLDIYFTGYVKGCTAKEGTLPGNTPPKDGTLPGNTPPKDEGLPDMGDLPNIDSVAKVLKVIDNITNWMFTIFIAVAVIFVLLAAFTYLTSGGGEETAKAHKMLLYSAVAIAVAILAKGVVNVVKSIVK